MFLGTYYRAGNVPKPLNEKKIRKEKKRKKSIRFFKIIPGEKNSYGLLPDPNQYKGKESNSKFIFTGQNNDINLFAKNYYQTW